MALASTSAVYGSGVCIWSVWTAESSQQLCNVWSSPYIVSHLSLTTELWQSKSRFILSPSEYHLSLCYTRLECTFVYYLWTRATSCCHIHIYLHCQAKESIIFHWKTHLHLQMCFLLCFRQTFSCIYTFLCLSFLAMPPETKNLTIGPSHLNHDTNLLWMVKCP